jgi:hypothetical protein
VSLTDEHGVGVPPLDNSCLPGTEDFNNYIAHLVGNNKGPLAYVARSLHGEYGE